MPIRIRETFSRGYQDRKNLEEELRRAPARRAQDSDLDERRFEETRRRNSSRESLDERRFEETRRRNSSRESLDERRFARSSSQKDRQLEIQERALDERIRRARSAEELRELKFQRQQLRDSVSDSFRERSTQIAEARLELEEMKQEILMEKELLELQKEKTRMQTTLRQDKDLAGAFPLIAGLDPNRADYMSSLRQIQKDYPYAFTGLETDSSNNPLKSVLKYQMDAYKENRALVQSVAKEFNLDPEAFVDSKTGRFDVSGMEAFGKGRQAGLPVDTADYWDTENNQFNYSKIRKDVHDRAVSRIGGLPLESVSVNDKGEATQTFRAPTPQKPPRNPEGLLEDRIKSEFKVDLPLNALFTPQEARFDPETKSIIFDKVLDKKTGAPRTLSPETYYSIQEKYYPEYFSEWQKSTQQNPTQSLNSATPSAPKSLTFDPATGGFQ